MSTTQWLACYAKLLELSQAMQAAAKLQDWDSLTRLGTTRNELILSLPPALPPLPADIGRQIAESIRDILACDEDIQARVTPWLQHTAKLLAVLGRGSVSNK